MSEQRWRREPGGVRNVLAALGLPVFAKPARLGSSVGIVTVMAALHLDSDHPKLWDASGLALPELCQRPLDLAVERFCSERRGHAF